MSKDRYAFTRDGEVKHIVSRRFPDTGLCGSAIASDQKDTYGGRAQNYGIVLRVCLTCRKKQRINAWRQQ